MYRDFISLVVNVNYFDLITSDHLKKMGGFSCKIVFIDSNKITFKNTKCNNIIQLTERLLQSGS